MQKPIVGRLTLLPLVVLCAVACGSSASDGRRNRTYERHRPETTTLYAVVRDNVETLYAGVAAGFDGAALPPFVRREIEGYLDCGRLGARLIGLNRAWLVQLADLPGRWH